MKQANIQQARNLAGKLNQAHAEMVQIHERSQQEGITVDKQAFEEPQQQLQDSFEQLLGVINTLLENSDSIEMPDGSIVNLPLDSVDPENL